MSLSQKPQTTSTPTVSVKVFQWFEKIKDNYDKNIQQILSQCERSAEKQQARFDKSNTEHITDLKNQHAIQVAQSDKTIACLEHCIDDYKAQIAAQQQTIEQLNSRYDAVISALLSQPKQAMNMKDIFSSDDFLAPTKTTSTETINTTPTLENHIDLTNINDNVESNEIIERATLTKQVAQPDLKMNGCSTAPEKTSTPSGHNITDIETKEKSSTENSHIELQINTIKQITDSDNIAINIDNDTHVISNSTQGVMDSTTSEPTEKDMNNLTPPPTEEINVLNETNNAPPLDEVFSQALVHRQQGEHKRAFTLFSRAAQARHLKAMGALGRAYFLAEGTDENPPLGLAWLIQAADKNLPQAITRVERYKSEDESLYQQAKVLSENLFTTD